MSTNGAIGFILDEKEYITYNHSDSYPTSLGMDVFKFVKDMGSVKGVKEKVKNITLVKQTSNPTKEQEAVCQQYLDKGVGGPNDKWYRLLRKAQGDLKAYLEVGHMIEGSGCLIDSFFIEWAYIINLDTQALEIYKGFNTNRLAEGRYARFTNDENAENGKTQYFGVKLIETFKIGEVKKMTRKQIERVCNQLKEVG